VAWLSYIIIYKFNQNILILRTEDYNWGITNSCN